jgi:hypothetical protein
MRSVSAQTRTLCALLLALLLAVRSLAPAGFMPAFEHGSLSIIVCPDADGGATPMAAHHHHSGDHQSTHQQCPYASASAPGLLGFDYSGLFEVFGFAAALLLGAAFLVAARSYSRARPPARAPPLPA